jgi:hypothetical protein
MAKRSSGGGKRARPAGAVIAKPGRRGRSDDADAFIRDPDSGGPVQSRDNLADTLGREFVTAATTGENAADEDLEQEVPEEVGGPFLESKASREYDPQPDESNPVGATKEALPTAMGSGPPTQVDLEDAEEAQTEDDQDSEGSEESPAEPGKR